MMAIIKKELCIKALKDAYELRRPGDGGPLVPARQTAQTMPPPTEAELRTLFRQPAKTGMQQRKPSRHILPYRAERMADSAKPFELDSCNKIKGFIYAPDAAKCRISGNPDGKCSVGWWVMIVL